MIILYTKNKINFKNVLKNQNNLKNINDDIISILNKGIKNKIITKVACKLLINQFKEFKKNKSFQYLNIKKLKAINFDDFNNNLEKLLLELNKIIEYLSNIFYQNEKILLVYVIYQKEKIYINYVLKNK